MSIILYSKMTAAREKSTKGKSVSSEPPGVKTYLDALAALVPAEVLAAHAFIMSITTATDADDIITITTPEVLRWSFVGLIVLSILLYVVSKPTKIDRWDWLRALIPALAFVAWTMLQNVTAFDGFCRPSCLRTEARVVIAIFLAIGLGILGTVLAKKADMSDPPSS